MASSIQPERATLSQAFLNGRWSHPQINTISDQDFGKPPIQVENRPNKKESTIMVPNPKFNGDYRREYKSHHSAVEEYVSGEPPEVTIPIGSSNLKNDHASFDIILDVSQFKPDEVTVRTVGHEVIINAKHPEREDEHGWISREFTRRYIMPLGVNNKSVSCRYSKGMLIITALKESANPTQIHVEVDPETQSNGPGEGLSSFGSSKRPNDPTYWKGHAIDPLKNIYESKSHHTSSSSLVERRYGGKPNGTRPKSMITDV